jgi:hypothetical protein
MRTTEIGNYYFNHNADYSGDVEICGNGGQSMYVPFETLAIFVADVVRKKKIDELEHADTNALLGVEIFPSLGQKG